MQVQDWSGQTWLGKLVPAEESVPHMTFHGTLPVMCHVVAVHQPLSRQACSHVGMLVWWHVGKLARWQLDMAACWHGGMAARRHVGMVAWQHGGMVTS